MHTSLHASTTMPPSAGPLSSRHADNLVYQAMTVAAMLLALVSIWIF